MEKFVDRLRLSLDFYYSVDSSAGSLLPAFRPMQDNRGDKLLFNFCLLGWVSLPAFRPMQDNGGDELLLNCCLLGWVSATCFQTNAG